MRGISVLMILLCYAVSSAANLQVDVPEKFELLELQTINVHCNVQTIDNITIGYRWLKDGDDDFQMLGSQLLIAQATSEKAGIYKCEAMSNETPPRRGEGTTQVIIYFQPRWENNRINKFAVEPPNPVTLECHTLSLPSPLFHWEMNKVNLTNSAKYTVTSNGNVSTLLIRDTAESDMNIHRCIGENIAGIGVFDIHLLRPGIPDAPLFCSLSEVAALNATIKCNPGYTGGKPLDFQGYKLAVNIERQKVKTEFEMEDDLAKITVHDLLPNSTYTILVHQINQYGESEEGVGVYVKTIDGIIPIAPKNPITLYIIIGAVCGGALLVLLIIISLVFGIRLRTSKRKNSQPTAFTSKKDSDDYIMEDQQSASNQSTSDIAIVSQRQNSWGSFKRKKKVQNNGTGLHNPGYKASSDQSINSHVLSYENAPTLQRQYPTYVMHLGHDPGESDVGEYNSGYNSPQIHPVGQQDVMLRRQLSDPNERAKTLSNKQPSLAGLGALSMLPDPYAVPIPAPLKPSVSPSNTPTQETIEAEFRARMGHSGFEPEVPWEFPRAKLYIRTKLGQGSFGEVWRARADGICGRNGKIPVAVKMLKEHNTPEEKRALLKELAVMKLLQPHPNIIQLLGCCTTSQPVCIIMELAAHGSLDNLLREQRKTFEQNNLSFASQSSQNKSLKLRDLIIFCVHIATAMEYISAKELLHRDLAARNVLVDESMICKVGDFGSAADIIEMRQYESRSQRRLPLRWIAPESMIQCTYSIASDVWSFGVLMWEIITLGSTPYPGMSGPDVMTFIQKGCRMSKPRHSSDAFYALMKDCWNQFAMKRPTFSIVRHRLVAILDEPDNETFIEQMEDNLYEIVQASPGEKC